MPGLIGKKVGMTQIFDESGKQTPVTVIQAGPCTVVRLRTKEKDGYSAVQLGFGSKKEKRLNKAQKGYFKKAGVNAAQTLKEIRTEDVEGLEVGKQVGASNFQVGDFVDVQGTSIGKGFQGVVKRHNFSGGEKAHGTKFGRQPGSIGQSAYPSRVIKGKKLAGQLGNEQVTVQNLKVVKVDEENNLIAVNGAVPGVEEGVLVVKSALKRGAVRKWVLIESAKEEKAEEKAETPSEAVAEQSDEKNEAADAPAPSADEKAEEGQEKKKEDKPEEKA